MANSSADHPTLRRFLSSLTRLAIIACIVGLAGWGIGRALGQAVAKIPDPTGGAVVLDQLSLGGLDSEVLVVGPGDVPRGWAASESLPGLVGAQWCGSDIEAVGLRASQETVSYKKDDSTLVTEVATFDRPQGASNYVSDVTEKLLDCPSYFQKGFDGKKLKIEVSEPSGKQPITDYVSRTFQPADRSGFDQRTIFQVGSSVVGLHYYGSKRPPRDLMESVESAVLARVDPENFGVAPTTVPGVKSLPSETTATLPESELEPAGADPNSGLPAPTLPG